MFSSELQVFSSALYDSGLSETSDVNASSDAEPLSVYPESSTPETPLFFSGETVRSTCTTPAFPSWAKAARAVSIRVRINRIKNTDNLFLMTFSSFFLKSITGYKEESEPGNILSVFEINLVIFTYCYF